MVKHIPLLFWYKLSYWICSLYSWLEYDKNMIDLKRFSIESKFISIWKNGKKSYTFKYSPKKK